MTNPQWETLQKTIKAEVSNPLPFSFIIDYPWLQVITVLHGMH